MTVMPLHEPDATGYVCFGAMNPAVPQVPDVSRDAVTAGEWMLNGRNALQRPMSSLATDYRTTAGEMAANAHTRS